MAISAHFVDLVPVASAHFGDFGPVTLPQKSGLRSLRPLWAEVTKVDEVTEMWAEVTWSEMVVGRDRQYPIYNTLYYKFPRYTSQAVGSKPTPAHMEAVTFN